ncbi:hypothetical protein TNCV_3938641 [Trichonephila clavipes]|nr:hypothetical protein TNCV_3938641 [Trichonephila clavipes]
MASSAKEQKGRYKGPLKLVELYFSPGDCLNGISDSSLKRRFQKDIDTKCFLLCCNILLETSSVCPVIYWYLRSRMVS